MAKSPIIVALDYQNLDSALALVDTIDPNLCRVKVGMELFTAEGPRAVKGLVDRGFDVFLDMKYYDIPNTVAGAVRSAADLGVWMVNLHASGGSAMMQAARNVLADREQKPMLIAVTVLTSSSEHELLETGVSASTEQQVLALAQLAKQSGMDGVVCSARESVMLKQALGDKFELVTPGIRPQNAEVGDQKRIVTPAQAIEQGSDYLVIGRPVTQAPDPNQALVAILQEIGEY